MKWRFYVSEIYSMLTRSALDPDVTEEDMLRMQLELLYSLYLTVDKLEQTVGADRVKQLHKEVHERIEQRYKQLMTDFSSIFGRP